jgi:GSH-dependent disulfide-bond oxidoreductase
MLELYHWEPTVHSGEPLICLTEKQLTFQSRYVDLLQLQQHEPDFLGINPSGQVPVLVHDGRIVTECGLILEYLDETFPERPLMPLPLVAQYEARFWIKYVAERMAPYVCLLGWHFLTRPTLASTVVERARTTIGGLPRQRQSVWTKALDDTYADEDIALARESLTFAATKLEEALRRGRWLAGYRYSMADIAVVLAVRAMRVVVPQVLSATRTPRTLEWLARVEERPAVREVLGHARTAAPERGFAPGPEAARWG